jgi:outer membrane protein TolC
MLAKFLKASVLGVIAIFCLSGATRAATTTLAWDDCVKLAQTQNPTLQSANKTLEAKEAAYRGSFNALFPNLSLGYSYSTSDLYSNMSGLTSNLNGEQQLQGNVNWDLFNLKDYASIGSASAALDQARDDLLLSSAQVRLQLRQAYFQLLYAQEQITLLEQIRQIRQTNSQMVTLEYNSGRESKGNMLITQADLASAEADLAQAQRNLRVAQQALNHVLGQPETEAVLVKDAFYVPIPPVWENIASKLPSLPQIKHDDALIAQAQASLQQAWSQVLPNLSANYSRGWLGQTFFPPNNEWSASLNLSWPIFSNGPTYAFFAIAGAQDQLDKTVTDKTADMQQVQSTAENAWSNLMSGIDQVKIQKQYQEAALQRNDEANIEYANGLLVFENWNQVVTALVSYEKQYLSARLNAVLAEINWQNALETPLEEK